MQCIVVKSGSTENNTGNVETSTIINGNGGNSVVGKMIIPTGFPHREYYFPTLGFKNNISHTGCQSTVTGAEFMVNQVDNVEAMLRNGKY